MLLGEGRRHGGVWWSGGGGTLALSPTYSSPLTFLFFSYRSFKSASSSFSSMKPLPSWITREGRQQGVGHKPHKLPPRHGCEGHPQTLSQHSQV